MCSKKRINPNQSYCGDGIGTIKPTIFREGYGSLGECGFCWNEGQKDDEIDLPGKPLVPYF